VDLILVHWPLLMNPEGNDDRFPKLPNGERDIIFSHNHVDTWKQMEAVLDTGLAKGIGVCNVGLLQPLATSHTSVPDLSLD